MNVKHMVIPVFVPHKGCPNDCKFCNQKTISGQNDDITVSKMKSIVDAYLITAPRDMNIEIGFYGGSFTGIEKNIQISLLELAKEYLDSGSINGIRLSTRPDYISREVIDYLKYYGVSTVELGVQSLDEGVLDLSCRGHKAIDVYNAAGIIKEHGIGLGIQTMIGLPGSNKDKEITTARKVVEIAPDIVRIYPTLVIKGTELEKMYMDGTYKPMPLQEAVDICCELLQIYTDNNINVIRIGLQPTDNIAEGKDVLAGPFHAAFRQLVESELYLRNIEAQIEKYSLQKFREIIIEVYEKNISDVVGQNKSNINYLKNKYKFGKIRVKGIAEEALRVIGIECS